MSIAMGLISFTRRGGKNWNSSAAFWIVNVLQTAYFGYVHVALGIVASASGGVMLQTATAP